MLKSGLRLEQAAKLRPCDLIQVEGVHCFDINSQAGRLKGKSSARLVPIHSRMQPHLSQWAIKVSTEDGPQANLWRLTADKTTGRWSEQLSKRLNARLDSAGINGPGFVTEYARNTFGAKLNAAGVSVYTRNSGV